MNFKDKFIFAIHRDEVGACTLSIRKYILWIIPYWSLVCSIPMHYLECLDLIEEWCMTHNVGTAIIHDPDSPNKKMRIDYRRFKNEELNELPQ